MYNLVQAETLLPFCTPGKELGHDITLLCILPYYAYYPTMHITLLCILPYYAYYPTMHITLLCILPYYAYYFLKLATSGLVVDANV
jgi:hypothetical protein